MAGELEDVLPASIAFLIAMTICLIKATREEESVLAPCPLLW